MEHYIEQLMEDFREASKRVPPPGPLREDIDKDNPNEVEDMAYIEEHYLSTPKPLSEIVGIETKYLPPMEKLTEEQAERLYTEMERMLNAYHFRMVFPDGLPAIIKYRCMCDLWDDKQAMVGAGEVEILICDSDPEICPFPEGFCDCKRIEEEWERE